MNEFPRAASLSFASSPAAASGAAAIGNTTLAPAASLAAAAAADSAALALVEQKVTSAKDAFFAKARAESRQRQAAAAAHQALTLERDDDPLWRGSEPSQHQPASSFSSSFASSIHGSVLDATPAATLLQPAPRDKAAARAMARAQRRAVVVRGIVDTSSVFNIDETTRDVKVAAERDEGGEPRAAPVVLAVAGHTSGDAMTHRGTVLEFGGVAGRRTRLDVFRGDAEALLTHIDRAREDAMLAALEASRSRTANETRQADAAATLQAFLRMSVARRRFLRHRATLAKQLRAIDQMRCCRAAALLARFCRGNLVRREYRLVRAQIAARRQETLVRRGKLERSSTPALEKVPPMRCPPEACSAEEWILDVFARFNVNLVAAVRAMAAGHPLDAITLLQTHIKTSTVSAKEQSSELLAMALTQRCYAALPPHVAAELLAKQTRGRRR
jgi:hypothetical protein